MNYEDYPISQSIIKKFFWNGEERKLCPHRIYNVDILKAVEPHTSDSMNNGKYFETKFIGMGARGDIVDDLPRKVLTRLQISRNNELIRMGKNPILGEKKIAQIRIDEQAQRGKVLCGKRHINIINAEDIDYSNVQVPLIIPWGKDNDVLLSMNMDIFPTSILINEKLCMTIIDLKLTADIHSPWGEYCYGTPEFLDNIQGKMYHYGVRNIDYSLNPHMDELITPSLDKIIKRDEILFFLWIFNYKKKELEDKFIEVKWDNAKEAELHESIRKTIALLDMFEAQGWPTVPDFKMCKNCPIKDCVDKKEYETI